jgi:putative transposase
LIGAVETRLWQLLCESCEKLNCQILVVEIMPDHVRLFINALPQLSPAEIMSLIKGYTSYRLRSQFEQVRRQKSLWTPSYFVGTAGNVSTTTIKRYVENQKKQS